MIYAITLLVVASLCTSSWCKIHDNDSFGFIFMSFIALFPMFLFSLITYKMREEVFQAWWSFARWFVPVIIGVTFLLKTSVNDSGGSLSSPGTLSFVVLTILYPVFALVSVVKIVRAYRRSKEK
jgi:hypothetical protein